VAVVDPGVGSERRPLIVSANEQFFVGPDNGLFSYIYDREPSHRTFHVTSDRYFRPSVSSTFHGRDIFAPVAAALSNGVAPEEFGMLIDDEVRLPSLETPLRIIHIDRFGNCITNITRDLIDNKKQPTLQINRRLIRTFKSFYADKVTSPDEPFAIWGSAGFLEISMNGQSAAQKLDVKQADLVILNHG
jgi:S-adenosylmethionine hydrolase